MAVKEVAITSVVKFTGRLKTGDLFWLYSRAMKILTPTIVENSVSITAGNSTRGIDSFFFIKLVLIFNDELIIVAVRHFLL